MHAHWEYSLQRYEYSDGYINENTKGHWLVRVVGQNCVYISCTDVPLSLFADRIWALPCYGDVSVFN